MGVDLDISKNYVRYTTLGCKKIKGLETQSLWQNLNFFKSCHSGYRDKALYRYFTQKC